MADSVAEINRLSSRGAAHAVLDHEGSASPVLSGRTVIAIWVISILLHLGALAALAMVLFPFVPRERADVQSVHVEIVGDPESTSFAASATPTASMEPASPNQPLDRITPQRFISMPDLSAPSKTDVPIIGIGTGGGDFSRYGLSIGGGASPGFFGLGRSARGVKSIVYVVDRSGSMIDTFGHVQAELKRSISALRRSQRFHVIFFSSGPPLENPPKRLVPAIKAHKDQFFAFLDRVFTEGSTEPGPAMRRALAVEPDMIYFLTDGAFNANLVEKLDRWNQNKAVRIFTIAYFDMGGASLLEEIARRNGGEFKFVSENDLP